MLPSQVCAVRGPFSPEWAHNGEQEDERSNGDYLDDFFQSRHSNKAADIGAG